VDCWENATLVEPPTPTDSIASQPHCNDVNIPYDVLLSKHTDLQSSHTALLSNVATFQSRISYYTNLYTYIEGGLTLKLAEFDSLKLANQRLKVINAAH